MNPGTVSKILWHFTGGPDWDTETNKQKTDPKHEDKAYDIIQQILKSSHLRLSSYDELIKVTIPKVTRYDRKERKKVTDTNVEKQITSSKVVCLADIPIQHLQYHASRYGKFAIGFHRESAIKNDFNPVFYSLNNTKVVNSIYTGFTTINDINTDDIESALGDIDNSISSAIEDLDNEDFEIDIDTEKYTIESELEDIKESKANVKSSLANFLAFVKTFSQDEMNSIYCEREWRSLKQFNFNHADIAMIILPKQNGYFQKLIETKLIPTNIPIIPWEDIIEH